MTDLKQILFEAFAAQDLDVTTSIDDVREYLLDAVSDDQIREAMKEAATATSDPSGTVVLTITAEVDHGRRNSLSGAVWAAADVEATVLDDEAVRALQDDMPYGSGSLTRAQPDRMDWIEYGAYLVPRKAGGYEANDSEAVIECGERIGTLYEAA